MELSVSRQLPALTAGLFVGIVLQEVLLSAFDLLNPGVSINAALIGLEAQAGWIPVLFCCWLISGLTAGMMSSLIGRSLTTGCVAGALLMIPALVIAQHAFPDSAQLAALFTITPLVAAALGAWLAGKITQLSERHHSQAEH